MPPDLYKIFKRLTALREQAGFTYAEVERELIVGPGWVERFESGNVEVPLSALTAMLNLYNVSLSTFFDEFDTASLGISVDRHLTAHENDAGIVLNFPMGKHQAQVPIDGATLAEYESVLNTFRTTIAARTTTGDNDGSKRQAIAYSFLQAVELWPTANPSDLWYFLIAHIYMDDLNHAAGSAGLDWSQSWKRAGGWSLEWIFVNHYNAFLKTKGVRLAMPSPDEKERLLGEMGISGGSSVEKSDVMVLGTAADGVEHPFGVVHVKASFAERRTDDVPLSQKLIAANYASPLVTMDCKATPAKSPRNKGELGLPQTETTRPSSKRLDIERDRVFDVAFAYNTNTIPTPSGSSTAARIYVATFADPDDDFAAYLIRKWQDRQGIY